MKKSTDNLSVTYEPCLQVVPRRLARLRRESGLTQKDVGNLLGITQQAYSNYERGVSEMRIEYFKELARFYNVSVDYITGVSHAREHYPDQ